MLTEQEERVLARLEKITGRPLREELEKAAQEIADKIPPDDLKAQVEKLAGSPISFVMTPEIRAKTLATLDRWLTELEKPND